MSKWYYELHYFCAIFKIKYCMKYKRLDSSELKALEKEFIHFLASAQITGSDWEKMKLEEEHQKNSFLGKSRWPV